MLSLSGALAPCESRKKPSHGIQAHPAAAGSGLMFHLWASWPQPMRVARVVLADPLGLSDLSWG